MDKKDCGNGPSLNLLLDCDPELKKIDETILSALNHGFEVSESYVQQFDHIRAFCEENDGTPTQKFYAEKG